MDVLGTGHLAAAVLAMLFGGVLLLSRKGTRWHRRWGWLYVGSMMALNATALAIYDLFGSFGPFHVAALVSVLTVMMGLIPVRRRAPRGRWLPMHAYWMSGSYVGLIAAAVSETATRYLDYDFGATVISASIVVIGIGVALMLARVPVAMRNMGRGAAATMLAVALLCVGCAGRPEEMSSDSGGATQPSGASEPSREGGPPRAGEPSRETVAAGIIRGRFVFGHEVRSFQPCGTDTPFWVIDDSGVLQTIHRELTGGLEPYTEIFASIVGTLGAAPAEGFGADYDGSLTVESVLYAGHEGPGCDADWESFRYRARGNEPFWMVEIDDAGMRLVRPGEADVQWGGDDVVKTAGAGGAPMFRAPETDQAPATELVLPEVPCRDSMSGAYFARSAELRFGEARFTGCALVGRW